MVISVISVVILVISVIPVTEEEVFRFRKNIQNVTIKLAGTKKKNHPKCKFTYYSLFKVFTLYFYV